MNDSLGCLAGLVVMVATGILSALLVGLYVGVAVRAFLWVLG